MSYFNGSYRLLDVGGTFIKCSDGREVPVQSSGGRDGIARAFREAAGPYDGLAGIAAAVPGPFDYKQGIFRMEHKFASVKGMSFRELARVPENVPTMFVHDVVALHMGAIRQLGLQDANCVLVTLGTGLGFSCAMKGRIELGAGGSPVRSLWNHPLPEGGILEDRLSARGISALYASLSGTAGISPAEISARAADGDSAALETYARTGKLLGEAVRLAASDIAPFTLLVGGQIAKSLGLMLGPLREELPGTDILRAPSGAVFEGLGSLFENQPTP